MYLTSCSNFIHANNLARWHRKWGEMDDGGRRTKELAARSVFSWTGRVSRPALNRLTLGAVVCPPELRQHLSPPVSTAQQRLGQLSACRWLGRAGFGLGAARPGQSKAGDRPTGRPRRVGGYVDWV
ncbi:hypothetical protein MAPG_10868 [Magnaporthiopsis poae ATCC 64411]|uniref:Uncharacterized protein n=1 Tax=Magnaporthiopsis poae (strain ATCC 64411 / 73-15) TaxID=644358 RepID=A0A0C4EDR0_MAGP6|nr:hypothetical protein MAPG_10868 [Magnaporthiopsis poae ATCC 64411]